MWTSSHPCSDWPRCSCPLLPSACRRRWHDGSPALICRCTEWPPPTWQTHTKSSKSCYTVYVYCIFIHKKRGRKTGSRTQRWLPACTVITFIQVYSSSLPRKAPHCPYCTLHRNQSLQLSSLMMELTDWAWTFSLLTVCFLFSPWLSYFTAQHLTLSSLSQDKRHLPHDEIKM